VLHLQFQLSPVWKSPIQAMDIDIDDFIPSQISHSQCSSLPLWKSKHYGTETSFSCCTLFT
jgi:hypothetical protein